MKNNLEALNNILFEQLEKLQDDENMEINFEEEIKKSKAIVAISAQVINGMNLSLKAMRFQRDELGKDKIKMPKMLEQSEESGKE